MPQRHYDVIIVGAGPAGIFTALELSSQGGLDILMLEKGPDIEKRHCPARQPGGHCTHCNPCMLLCGWGGAGAFSDGKLTLSPAVGGHLAELVDGKEARELIQRVDETFVQFGATGPIYGTKSDEIERLEKRAALAGLRLIAAPIRHMGTERARHILRAMRDELVGRGVEIRTRTKVASLITRSSRAVGVETIKGEVIEGQYVVVAPGREGAPWLKEVAKQLSLSLGRNPVDVGVRVELPAEVLAPLTDLVYEPKLHYYSRAFDDRVRTFCLPPDQQIICRTSDELIVVKPIADYQEGDCVLTFDFTQRAFRFVQPQLHTVREYKGKIHRIKVAGNGVVKSTADHLFFVKKGGEYILKRAEELQVGDLLPVGRDYHIAELDQLKVMHFAITEISTLDYTGEVYDFVIPETHNFIAGDLPFIIHNCVCPYGEVVIEFAGDVMTVNGHSYADRRTENTNFAILVSKTFTEPFKEPIAYGKHIASLANLLGGGIIVQRLGDLEQGRRSTEQRLARSIVTPTLKEATPGDLGLVLPYRYWVNILEMLRALDELAPGVYSRHTLLYGVEVKFYSSRLQLSKSLETEVENLFAAGDGAGVTRGLVQASASGLVVAREILARA